MKRALISGGIIFLFLVIFIFSAHAQLRPDQYRMKAVDRTYADYDQNSDKEADKTFATPRLYLSETKPYRSQAMENRLSAMRPQRSTFRRVEYCDSDSYNMPYGYWLNPEPGSTILQSGTLLADFRFNEKVIKNMCDSYVDSLTLDEMSNQANKNYLGYLTMSLSISFFTTMIPVFFSDAQDVNNAAQWAGGIGAIIIGYNEAFKFKEKAAKLEAASCEIQATLSELNRDYLSKRENVKDRENWYQQVMILQLNRSKRQYLEAIKVWQ